MWKNGFKGNTGKSRSEESRLHMSEAQKRRFADPAKREEAREIQKALWATPEYQAKIAAQKAAWTPERRAAASAFAKALIYGQ